VCVKRFRLHVNPFEVVRWGEEGWWWRWWCAVCLWVLACVCVCVFVCVCVCVCACCVCGVGVEEAGLLNNVAVRNGVTVFEQFAVRVLFFCYCG
jgi:hypothetical protein